MLVLDLYKRCRRPLGVPVAVGRSAADLDNDDDVRRDVVVCAGLTHKHHPTRGLAALTRSNREATLDRITFSIGGAPLSADAWVCALCCAQAAERGSSAVY